MESLVGKILRQDRDNATHRRRAGKVLKGKNKKEGKKYNNDEKKKIIINLKFQRETKFKFKKFNRKHKKMRIAKCDACSLVMTRLVSPDHYCRYHRSTHHITEKRVSLNIQLDG
jgi:hypothetical protein